jgi:lipooligosaccharide transport system permease protein
LGVIPLFLFSGVFFPISQLPTGLRIVAYATPLWHGVNLCRSLTLGRVDPGIAAVNASYLVALTGMGVWAASRAFRSRLRT